MTISITSPITGSAGTGLTSPTYTVVDDTAPNLRSLQKAVTSLGGTQTGVRTHAVGDPFTITFSLPGQVKTLPPVNPITGVLRFPIPRNKNIVRTRKGVTVLSGQPLDVATIETTLSIPAGAEVADAVNIRAAISAHIGTLSQISAGLGDTVVTGLK